MSSPAWDDETEAEEDHIAAAILHEYGADALDELQRSRRAEDQVAG